MQKFNMTKEKCIQMSQGMAQNFAAVGLPYQFTDKSLTGNTFNSHRLIAWAGSMGPDKQDAVVEELFLNYFGEEKFLNDPAVLIAAAVKAGIPEADARAFVTNESAYAAETQAELNHGASLRVSGVPFFEITNGGKTETLSGAQPEQAFEQIFRSMK